MNHSMNNSLTNVRLLWPVLLFTALLGFLLALGISAGNQRAADADAAMRGRILRLTVDIARSINPDLARKLTFTPADKGTPAFQVIGEQMIAAGKRIPNRGIYSMACRGGTLFFGPETYPENDPQASPVGTQYKEPPVEASGIFRTKRPVTVGPYKDEYGTFVSALPLSLIRRAVRF